MKRILILFLIVFLLAGCNIRSMMPSTNIKDEEIHKGTDGLILSFKESVPPAEVYEDEIFPIGIELFNKGAFDIEDGYLVLSIDDNLELVKGNLKESFELDGKSIGNTNGRSSSMQYMVKAKDVEESSNIRIKACYKYETLFNEEVCVDTDFYNLKKVVKACSSKPLTFSSGQGSPVTITKIEPRMIEDENLIKPSFNIYIKNEKDGIVINSNEFEVLCSSDVIKNNSINLVNVEAKLFETDLVCTPSVVKLKDNEGVVKCELEEGIENTLQPYDSLLTVSLEYGYKGKSVSKSVKIKEKP